MPKKEPRLPATDRLQMRLDYAAAAYAHAEASCHVEVDALQARQRQITAWSLAVVAGVRPDIQTFTAVLIQYGPPGRDDPEQIVPDNFVVRAAKPIEARDHYDVPFQPARPFVVFEYPSTPLQRKRIGRRVGQYEHNLAVPYVVRFDPESGQLAVQHLIGSLLVPCDISAAGRAGIPELELELGVIDGVLRFWFRGELVPLPAEVLNHQQEQAAEIARLRKELVRAKGG